MKRKIVRVLVILLLLICILVVNFGFQSSQKNKEITRVSIILPHDDDGYWNLIRKAIEKNEIAASEFGIDINILLPQLNYNVEQMTELIKKQVAAQVDVIVVQGNQNAQFLKALREAYEQGIQIICVDTDIEDFPKHTYIGTDNYTAGRLMGQQLVSLVTDDEDVIVVSGAPGYSNLQQRYQGMVDVVGSHSNIQISDVYYDYYDALTFMNLYHSYSNQANILVCLEGTGGSTLTTVYKSHDSSYKYIVGFDSYEGVKQGVIDGIIKQDTSQMGNEVVKSIIEYVKSGVMEEKTIYTDSFWVTKDNYDEVIK